MNPISLTATRSASPSRWPVRTDIARLQRNFANAKAMVVSTAFRTPRRRLQAVKRHELLVRKKEVVLYLPNTDPSNKSENADSISFQTPDKTLSSKKHRSSPYVQKATTTTIQRPAPRTAEVEERRPTLNNVLFDPFGAPRRGQRRQMRLMGGTNNPAARKYPWETKRGEKSREKKKPCEDSCGGCCQDANDSGNEYTCHEMLPTVHKLGERERVKRKTAFLGRASHFREMMRSTTNSEPKTGTEVIHVKKCELFRPRAQKTRRGEFTRSFQRTNTSSAYGIDLFPNLKHYNKTEEPQQESLSPQKPNMAWTVPPKLPESRNSPGPTDVSKPAGSLDSSDGEWWLRECKLSMDSSGSGNDTAQKGMS